MDAGRQYRARRASRSDLRGCRSQTGTPITSQKAHLESVGRGKLNAVREFAGAELVGLEYVGPWPELPAQQGFATKVVGWDIVGEEEGTGIVHIAPGCGAEDYELSQEHGLHVIVPIDGDGNYVEGFGSLSGRNITETNEPIFAALEEAGIVYRIEDYTHRYPVCWRCGEEVAFRLVDEWFISAEEIRGQMLAENQTVDWVPEYGRKRMDDWLNQHGRLVHLPEAFLGPAAALLSLR